MKKRIREKVLSLRLGLSPEELNQKSQSIQAMLFSTPDFVLSRGILFYWSVKNEVVTAKMICDTLKKGKNVFLPVVSKGKKTFDLYEVTSIHSLIKGAYNVMEPDRKRSRRVNVKEVDLVIVPGISFDTTGNRIGYGKGYYDRFFQELPPSVRKIAIAFDLQIVSNIVVSSHDVKVHSIITESIVIHCT